MVESAATDEKQEERDRCRIQDQLVEVRKRKDEEDEARCLIEEMQRNLDAAQNKSFEAEQKLYSILWEYIEVSDKERGRPKIIMTKLWQLMQSRDTKNLNLEKDFEEILSKIKQTGGMNPPGQEGSGPKTKTKSNNRHRPGLKPQMESILCLVAECFSVKEMKALQSACMRTSTMEKRTAT